MMNLESNESYRLAVAQARAMACYGTSASVCTKFRQNDASDLYFAREGVNHLKYNVIHRYYSEGFKNENLELDSDDYQAAYGL
jgi:hypothetical protein